MFIESKPWNGLSDQDSMTEVYSRVVPTPYKCPTRQIAQKPKKGGEFTGTIAAPIRARGFGFISPDSKDNDVFFHIDDNPNAEGLRQGTRVSYDVKRDIRSGKTSAINVRPA